MNDTLTTIWKKVLEKTIELSKNSGIYNNFSNYTVLSKLENNTAIVTSYNQLCITLFNSDPTIKKYLEESLFEIMNEQYSVKFEKINNEIPQKYVPKIKSDLNPNLTFEQFVIGKNNEMPYNILFHTTQKLGEINPIFLYGDPGLGKTHLLCSVGNELLKHNPDSKVLYLSATNFSNRVSDAHSNKTLSELKQFFFDLDLLLIDDIQTFKSTHELAQNIFFEIFNELIANKKQIIITSDTSQDKLKNILHGRLTSRFKSGITLTVKKPEIDTARKIVIKKIENNKNSIPFTPEVIDYIAKNFNDDIRGLEGAINTILLYAIYNPDFGENITVAMAMEALNQTEETIEFETLTPKLIKEFVATKYHISVKQLDSNSRTKQIVYPRHISIYLTRQLLKLSFEQIADLYNKKDHTTIINSIKKIEEDIIKNEDFSNEINKFIKELTKEKE